MCEASTAPSKPRAILRNWFGVMRYPPEGGYHLYCHHQLLFLPRDDDELVAPERGFADRHAQRLKTIAADLAQLFLQRRCLRRGDQLVDVLRLGSGAAFDDGYDFFAAEQALEYGLADIVITIERGRAHFLLHGTGAIGGEQLVAELARHVAARLHQHHDFLAADRGFAAHHRHELVTSRASLIHLLLHRRRLRGGEHLVVDLSERGCGHDENGGNKRQLLDHGILLDWLAHQLSAGCGPSCNS